MKVTIFVNDIGAAAAARQAGSVVERIPPRTLIPSADAGLGLNGKLVSHFADKPLTFEDAPEMSDAQWKDFLDSRFRGQQWSRWFGQTPSAIFSVVVVFETDAGPFVSKTTLRDKHGRPMTSDTRTEDMPEAMVKSMLSLITVGGHCLVEAKKAKDSGTAPKRFCEYINDFGNKNSVCFSPLSFEPGATTYDQLGQMLGLPEGIGELLSVYSVDVAEDMSQSVDPESARRIDAVIGLNALRQSVPDSSSYALCSLSDNLTQVFEKTVAHRAASTTLGDMLLAQVRKAKESGAQGIAFDGFVGKFQWTYGVCFPQLPFVAGVTTYEQLGKWLGFSKGMPEFFEVYGLGSVENTSKAITEEEFKRIDSNTGLGRLRKWVQDPALPTRCAYSDMLAGIGKKQQAGKTQNAGCFVATVCYASYDAPQVQELRWFRDHILLSHSIGSIFVAAYYVASPPFARWLKNHLQLATVIRFFLLDPLVHSIERSRNRCS